MDFSSKIASGIDIGNTISTHCSTARERGIAGFLDEKKCKAGNRPLMERKGWSIPQCQVVLCNRFPNDKIVP